jgi:hypothetical protein
MSWFNFKCIQKGLCEQSPKINKNNVDFKNVQPYYTPFSIVTIVTRKKKGCTKLCRYEIKDVFQYNLRIDVAFSP